MMERYLLIKEYDKVEERTSKDIVGIYDSLTDEYEKYFCLDNGQRKPDPGLVAEALASVLGDQHDAKILDVASGTGLVGLELADRGFKNVDAIDGSENMIKRSTERGIYQKSYVSLFSDKPTEGLETESYDASISTASFGRKHLPAAILVEFIRLTKPGGHIIIGILEEFLTQDPDTRTFEGILERLCKEGKCRLVEKKVCPVFDYNRKPGFVFIIQKS